MQLLVIDGNSVMNRAFYAIRLLSNQKGIYTNALFGFMNIYLKTVQEVKPDQIAVAFDLREKTFRHKAVESYKANRKGMPEELAIQMPYIKKLLGLLGVKVVTCEGYEADDILGTLSDAAEKQGGKCTILTGDRDCLQLITERVTVRLLTNKETIVFTPDLFRQEYGFEPVSMIDLKALMGDSSDNITGISGVGAKTATALIQRWGTIENLYENIENAELKPAAYKKIANGREAAEQSKWLATIVKDAPIETDIKAYVPNQVNESEVKKMLMELEMVKLLEKLNLSSSDEIKTDEEKISMDIEKITLTVDICSELEDSEVPLYYIMSDGKLKILNDNKCYETNDEELIFKFLESHVSKKTFYSKPDYRFMMQKGSTIKNICSDGEISAYLLNPTTSEYNISRLCVTYHVPYFEGNGENADLVSLPKLCDTMDCLVKEQDMQELYEMELQLTEVLASMENDGIEIDIEGVKEFGAYLSEQIEELQQMIYDDVGHIFNIGSPKQLGEVLFGELNLPHGKKTKTGYSTNAEILESLRDISPVVDNVLKWRQVSKLKSTYVDGLLKTVGSDGRIHSVFRQTETRTGRISSTEPNMQNIPVRTELGKNMRKFFRAKEGCILLDADYSQIELRILANLCEDIRMQEAFLSGDDIHTETASKIFNISPEDITSDMRSAAKAVNFGILYGMGAFSLSKDIHVSIQQADKYIKNYLSRYPNVEKFMDKIVNNAKANGYVTTYFNRRRPVPELKQSNKVVQAAGRRIAMNTPIQGTAADVIKMAMVNVYNRLKNEVPEAKLILQVHDELIVEVPQEHSLLASLVLGEEMQKVVDFKVPLTADVSMGKSWYDAKN